jgi:hypothetical protein
VLAISTAASDSKVGNEDLRVLSRNSRMDVRESDAKVRHYFQLDADQQGAAWDADKFRHKRGN